MRKKTKWRDFDKIFLFIPLAIFLVGILSVYSASFKSHQTFHQTLALKQCFWMGAGMLLVMAMTRFNYFRLQDFAWPLYFLSLFFLVVVLFAPARLGARRWLDLGFFNFQPSELAKISVILVLARYFSNNRFEYASRRKIILPFVLVAAPFLLILKEPDLGTGLLLVPVFLSMLYLWGFKTRLILFFILIAAAAAPFLTFFLKDYQKMRLLVFMNPNLDPLGAGYTIIQSKIAIGSGGLLGKGFMGGTQTHLQFLPEKHTDFIFGVVGEEGGFLAALLILALFWLLIKRGYSLAGQTPDRFGSQLACGISTLLAFQVFINIGMTMGLLPVVGVPLPLVSYGGSSVIMTMFSIGLLLNIKLHRPLF